MKKAGFSLIAMIFLLSQCTFFRDFMHMSPPEVLSHAPAAGVINADEISGILVVFSQPMNTLKTEQAFTLSENILKLEGAFSWQGHALQFLPFSGFKTNRSYTVTITKAAEDLYGNSLQDDFYFTFSTGMETNRPRLVSHSPADEGNPASLQEPIIIAFSEPVDPESFYKSFSISPPVAGSFTWNADGSAATFHPIELYEEGDEYLVELSADVFDLSGNKLAEGHSFRFVVGARIVLTLDSLIAVGSGLAINDISSTALNHGIEKDELFRLGFNAAVPLEQSQNILAVSPSAANTISWSGDYTSCTVRFADFLESGRVYELVILDKTYRIQIDGIRSVPLQISRLSFCNDKTVLPDPVFTELSLNMDLGVSASTTACLDFYIRHATGASIDTGSFINALSIDSAVVSFVFRSIENPADAATPSPDPPPGPDVSVVRLNCEVIDSMSSGIIAISFDTVLKDSFGNVLPSKYVMQVNRP